MEHVGYKARVSNITAATRTSLTEDPTSWHKFLKRQQIIHNKEMSRRNGNTES